MSIFLMVGCIGLAGAPFIITSIVSSGGFNKLWLLSIPGVILAIILTKVLTGVHETGSGAKLSDLKILFVKKSRPLWIMLPDNVYPFGSHYEFYEFHVNPLYGKRSLQCTKAGSPYPPF